MLDVDAEDDDDDDAVEGRRVRGRIGGEGVPVYFQAFGWFI